MLDVLAKRGELPLTDDSDQKTFFRVALLLPFRDRFSSLGRFMV